MATLASIMAELKKKGTEKTSITYSRHGMPRELTFGVLTADMKAIAKTIKGEQELAYELYDTGMMEAMTLAGMVVDGSLMTRKQLDRWVEGAARLGMIGAATVPAVTVENPHARELALKWIRSKKEHIAVSGWHTYLGILATTPDEALELREIDCLLGTVVQEIHGAQNRVRSAMNQFVIAVGTYVKPLLTQAKAAAKQIGIVTVDMGDTACQVPLATASIAKVEAMGRVGKKRKTMRC